jgi:RNA polymerase sigma-70 factor (ECF subfamily)
MAQGPIAVLASLDALDPDSTLTSYHLLPSVRGDLLIKLGRFTETREEIQRAIAMTENRREQDLLSEKTKADTEN